MNLEQKNNPSQHPRALFMEWYHSTSAGQALRDSESAYIQYSLQHTYYQKILQVGRSGSESRYLDDEFLGNFALITDETKVQLYCNNTIRATHEDWPVACDSIDLLILPHLLEFESEPNRVLCEAERVLKPEGQILVLGFNPWSLPNLMRHRSRSQTPWDTHLLSSHQVMSWLDLLKFDADLSAGFGTSPNRTFFEPHSAWQKPIASLMPAYAIKAIKRKWTPTPIQQAWMPSQPLLPRQAMAPPAMRSRT